MYTLTIEGRKSKLNGMEKTFHSFDEVLDFIENNWDNNADYWISVNGNPAMEVRDIW